MRSFITGEILPLFCIIVSFILLIFSVIDGDVTYSIFWGVILIVNQNTLYFNSLKKDLEDKRTN